MVRKCEEIFGNLMDNLEFGQIGTIIEWVLLGIKIRGGCNNWIKIELQI